jgi:hypothetical protein
MEVKEVICKRWFLLKKYDAITLYPFIFYKGEPTETTRKHEWKHVEQVRRLGVAKFYLLYLFYIITLGYKKNPFEIEAYEN